MTVSLQFLSLFIMMFSGVITAAGVDAIRFIYSHAKPGSIVYRLSNVLEVAAWLFLGIGTFYVLFIIRDGAWRIYDPLAQVAGIFLYEAVFQRPFRAIGRVILFIFFKPIWFLIQLIITIIQKIIQFIVNVTLFLLIPFKKMIKIIKKTPLKRKRK